MRVGHEGDIALRERLLHGVDLRARRLDVGGIATAALDGGDGSPLILLHGGIERGGGMWAPVVARLAENHHLVIPDVPGLGESAYTTARAKVRHVKTTMGQFIRAGTKQVSDADLASISVPVALLWGRHHRMAPLPVAEAAAARLGWPLLVIDGAAHAPHIEQPEAFVAALLDAIDTPPTNRSAA